MTKRALLILAILILCCALTACNPSADEETNGGITISGRATYNGTPLADVKVFHGENVTYSNEYGIFVLSNLAKQDVVYFVLDGYDFDPDKINVTKNIYDLEIVATKTEKSADESQNNPPETETEEGNNDEETGNKPEEGTPEQEQEQQLEEIIPNCTNGALIVQNSTIKFAFCVDNDFTALVFSTIENGIETVISPVYSKVDDIIINGKTFALYNADVSDFTGESEVQFFVKASNEKFTTGTVASAVYCPAVSMDKPVLTLDENTLKWTSVDNATRYTVLANGVIVSSTTDTSYDVSSIDLSIVNEFQIRAEFANGIVTYSNAISTDTK